MANKKDWREEYKEKNPQEESEKSNWRDKYKEYYDYNSAKIVGEKVTSMLEDWQKNYNSYVTDYTNRFSKRKGSYEDAYVGDSLEWLNAETEKRSALKKQEDDILAYLNQYGGHLDSKWVKQVFDTIEQAKDAQYKIHTGATQDNEYWNSFGSEELLGKYGSAQGAYEYYQRTNQYNNKYSGLSFEDLNWAAGILADGEEKEWLTSYAASVDYDEKSKYDVAAGETEIAALEKELLELDDYIANAQEILAAYYGAEYDKKAAELFAQFGGTGSGAIAAIEEKKKQIAEKKKYLDSAKSIQKLLAFESAAGNRDFAEKSKYVNNVEYDFFGKPKFTDDTYAYVNNPTVEDKRPLGTGETTARELIDFEHRAYSWDTPNRNRDSSYAREALDYMKPEEVAIYNYYYATEGPEKAREYLDLLVDTFKERKNAETVEKAAAYANKHPVLSSIMSVGTSIGSGFEYIEDVIEYGGDKLFGKDAQLDTNENALITNAVRNTVAEKVDWEIGNWDAFDFVYNTTMSGIDSLASTAFGGAGGVVLGLSAAAQGTNDALERGMSDGQAFWNGLFSGVFEGLFESISIGQFNALKETAINVGLKNIDKTVIKTFAKNLGKSMLVNASEEMLTEIANITYDTLVNGEFANYTLEELQNGAWKKALNQVIESGASGALMGMGMSALGSSIGHKKGVKSANEYAVKNYGKNTDVLIQEGLGNDKKSASYKLAQKYQQKTNSGKTLTGQQIRNLLAANKEQVTANDMKKIQKAAEKRLTDLGQTKDVSELAEIATKLATGQEITRAEKRLLTHSEYGAQVAKEMRYSVAQEEKATYKPLEKRVEAKAPVKVSDTGKTVVRDTDEEIDLKSIKIKDITEDSVVVDVNGKDVDISDVDFATEDQWNMFNALKKIEHITPGVASAMVAKVDMAKPIWGQMNGMDEAYTYGFYGYSEADLKAGLFTGSLTKEQLNDAYKLGQYAREKSATAKADAYKQMRTAAQAQAEKEAKAEGKKTASKAKNLTITYNKGNGEVVSFDEAGIIDAKQSSAVEVAKILHQLGLGTRVEFFSSHLSETLTDKKGNPARVFLNDQGVEQRAYSGVYRKSDGTIRVDLNAYNGRGLTLNALSHELTHFIQQWSDQKYQVLVDFLMKEYEKTDMTMHERVLREQKRLENIRGEEVSYDEAYDEVVANAMSKMFDDGKLVEKLTKLKEQDMTLAQKLWEGFKKILAKFMGIYEKEGALFQDAADLMEMKETFEQLQNMFAEALVEASENYQASLTVSESQTLTEAGIGFDEDTKSVYSLHFSTAFKDEIQVGKKTFNTEAIAQVVAKGTGRSIEDARKWVQSELTIANIVMANPEFLDFEADDRYDAIKKNSDYPQGTVDLSNLCPKREEFTTIFDMLQKKYPNKLFTAQDVAEMRKILSDNDITVACGACFVEDRRQLLGEIADTYINMWKEAVETGKPLQKTNAAGVKSDLLVTKALSKQYGLTAGTKIMATDTYIPNQYDLTTYEGFKLLEKNHPTIAMGFNRYNNSRGQQSARLIEGRAEYKRQILGWSDAKVRSVNNNGGLRIFSFSDFEVVHLLDLAQVIIDCAAKGVKIQGYTKIPAFAKLVRDTGIKLNRSLIPKGDYGYHMENGKVVLDYDTTEGINIKDKNFIDESNNPNVGNIVIGINPTQIGAAMLDPFIDYIIPFHSNKAKEILKKLGTGEWVNYKESQHEKDISTGTSSKHNVNIYTEVINKYHPTNKVEFVEAFLNECKRQGKIPRYAEFLNVDENGDYAYREGYHKLLVDFKMFDAEGNILPQGNITPKLDEGFMTELLNAEIDKKQNYEFPQKVYEDIDKKFGEQYSSQEADIDSDGNQLTKEQQAYFANSKVRDENGNLLVVYHGTPRGGTTVFDVSKTSKDNDMGQGIYFSTSIGDASEYMGKSRNKKLYSAYVNIKNPFVISDTQKISVADAANLLRLCDDRIIASDVYREIKVNAKDGYITTAQLANSNVSIHMTEMLKKSGKYDGIIDETVSGKFGLEKGVKHIIALKSNQIKSVDNETPTSDPDIRYSSQDTDIDSKANPYSYNTLVSKPDMVVTTVSTNIPKNRADVVYQAKQNAAKVGAIDPKTGSVSVHVDDVGTDVLLGTEGLKHGLRRTKDAQNDANYIVTLKAGEIIKNSIKINETNPKKQNATGSYVLIGIARNTSGDLYIVRSVVNQFKNELAAMDVLYAINAKKELAATKSPRSMAKPLSVTSSTISIAELLDIVNQYFPDVLPEDVLKHYGYDARPEGDLGDGMLYSEHDTDYSNRSLLANAFEGITRDSIEYKMIQEYKGHIKNLNALEKNLNKLNEEIRKIYRTPGKRDTARLQKLTNMANAISNEITRHDRELLSLEASEPLRKVLQRERKKEAQKTKEHIAEIQQNKKVRAEQTELRHKIRKTIRDLDKILNRGNKKQNVKEDMKGFASKALELSDYLFTDHISNDDLIRKGITVRMTPKEAALVKETEDILSKLYDHADSLTDEEFTQLDAKRKENEDKLRDLLTTQRNERLNTPVYNLFNDLVTEYAKLKNSNQDAVKAAYNPEVERFLRSYIGEANGETDSDRKTLLQNMRVADMTTDELWKLHNAYKMVLHSVRTANELFVKGKTETLEQRASRIIGDFANRKIPDKKVAIVARNIANKIGWDYEKLYYALDRIGSEAFTELVMNIANSENIVMQDIMEAVAFRDEMIKKYGFNNWAVNKKLDREFLDNTGKKFKLTMGELMSLYAYSRRENAWDHIEYGGFAFGKTELTDPKPADTYKLTKEQCEAMFTLLTKEQKGYAEDMQKYLSEVMGGKGNEVSMLLYGIKMFGENNYFPLHVYGAFKAQADEAQAKAAEGFTSMSNAGFTHARTPNAKAPIVLDGFNEVWADHVNEMSRYHGTVPALEDMRRVMNRSFYSESGMESMAIKQLMINNFGEEAVKYFDNLYREANSGAITDKLEQKHKKLLSLFRKNSVAYSLSVVIQQPSAMSRAYAMIDKKYFGFKGVGALASGVAKAVSSKWNPAYANAYNEMKKYAPGVTMAKEIGGFDTHTGSSIREYLLDTGKSFKQSMQTENLKGKAKAALDLVDNNAIANLPAVTDKIAWIEIWNACKRETLAKHKDLAPTSEEFMQAVGERFTEVIRATQVYDSMFSKSPMLKSKNLAVQYLVSFMNEPNTTANMVEKAVRDATKGDWKSGVRTAVAVTSSIIFNNVLKAVIYAMRDDDEDETYIEKYAEAVVSGMIADFNPLSYIPYVRDVVSKLQGYDVERPDMAIVTDAIEAYQAIVKIANKDTENLTEQQLAELDKKVTDASWKLVGSVAAFFGIPVKNIYREIDGIIDHVRIASANAGMTTPSSVWDKVTASIPFLESETAKADKLYEAILSGDKAYIDRLKAGYVDKNGNFDQGKYDSAVVKALRENDPRIKAAAQANVNGNAGERNRIKDEIKAELGTDYANYIILAINAETSAIRNEGKPDKVAGQYGAYDFVEAVSAGDANTAKAVREDIISTYVANGKTQTEAEKAFVSDVKTGIEEAYSYGDISKDVAKDMLIDYANMDEEDAADKITIWDFLNANPDSNLSDSKVLKYLEFAEPAHVSLEVYEQFINDTADLKDIKDKWGDVEVTKREQVLEVIDSLPLSWQQKDALYLAYGYAESKIWDVPW